MRQNDNDFGAGGAAVLVDLPANGGNPTHLVIGGGKDNVLYLLNRDTMGGYGDRAWQKMHHAHWRRHIRDRRFLERRVLPRSQIQLSAGLHSQSFDRNDDASVE